MSARPPGPSGGLLGLDHLGKMKADLLGFCAELVRNHGDCVYFAIANIPIFQFTHPEQIHEVLVTRARSFHKTRRLKQVLGQWNGNGLVLNDGEPWIRQRRLVQPAFRQQQLKSHIDAIARRGDRMLDAWTGNSDIDISAHLGRFTLGVVAEALFGADVERHTDRFIEEVAVLNETAISEMSAPFVLPMWAPLPAKRRMRRAVEFLKGIVERIIADRRGSTADHGDLLARLLAATDDEGDGGRMTDEQVRDESINLLLGGNETTATALTWTAHLLSRSPEIQDQLHAEIDEVLGAAAPTFDAIPRLRLTEMAFKEALRLYPPVYIINREAIEDLTIGPYSIPRGANVQVIPYITQRDPRWFDAPDAFRPGRFASEDALPRGAYIPFGAGPRACIGKGFAFMEGTLILAMLLRRFRLRPIEGAPPVQMEAQISLHPKGGLRLALSPR